SRNALANGVANPNERGKRLLEGSGVRIISVRGDIEVGLGDGRLDFGAPRRLIRSACGCQYEETDPSDLQSRRPSQVDVHDSKTRLVRNAESPLWVLQPGDSAFLVASPQGRAARDRGRALQPRR